MRSFLKIEAIAISLVCTALSACGGGGGGSNDQSVVPFTGFSNIPDNGITELNGQAITASYDADTAGNVVISNPSGHVASTATFTTEDGVPVALDATAQGSSFSFDTIRGDTRTVSPPISVYMTQNGQDSAVFINPVVVGYEYQTFGTWLTGFGTSSGTVAAASYGSRTSKSSMPIGANATYSGVGLGLARRSDGQPYETVSTVSVTTDFATAGVSSSNTQAINLNTGATNSASELDFSGAGAVSGSGFVANVSGPGTSGSAHGQFYGPRAEEVGGTFSTTGAGGVVHAGSFGGN